MRIFILGNGPSLRITPLERLSKEDTMAMNLIHKIYPSTTWRPKYFLYVDFCAGMVSWRDPIDINRDIAEHMWLLDTYRTGFPRGHGRYAELPEEKAVGEIGNATWVPVCSKHSGMSASNKNSMKEWHLPQICTSLNGINPAIQIAVSLGYDEIYLLGCDLGYQYDITKNHFDPNYNEDNQPPSLAIASYWAHSDEFNARAAHEIAKKECEKRGVKIFNATIGGSLETYQRVNIEDVI